MTDQTVAPVSKAARVASLDVLRGISLLGILMMNITAFGLLFQAYDNPLADGGGTGIDLTVYKIINVGFEGTMRGIFSILFGAGVVLLTERMEKGGAGIMAAEIHFRRMMWMMLFGIIHWALLLWTGEILFLYSMCGLLVFAPRKLPAKVQLAVGLVLLVCAALFTSFDYRSKIEAHDKAVAAQAVQAEHAAEIAANKEAIAEANKRFGELLRGLRLALLQEQIPRHFCKLALRWMQLQLQSVSISGRQPKRRKTLPRQTAFARSCWPWVLF